jgi:hypothetical protein
MPGRLKNSEFYSYMHTDDNFIRQVIDFVDNNLVGNIFHITSKERLLSIQSAGFLKAITGNDTFGSQSKSCYGRQKGWICLFDFRSATDEQIEDSCHCCLWDLLADKLINPVALIIHQDAYSEIKFQEEIKPYYLNQIIPGLNVPDTECWYPRNLSFEKMDVVETCFKRV